MQEEQAFQSTLPRGERRFAGFNRIVKGLVSIHAPTGGATPACIDFIAEAEVSIHAPTGGATFFSFFSFRPYTFQSTLPRGERLAGQWARLCPACFNPRSHGGSDAVEKYTGLARSVSIHAPTGGATIYTALPTTVGPEFQSTLPRGERLCLIPSSYFVKSFQSTLPRGERR